MTEGITLLGAEMLTWSDADGERGSFGGLLAPHLLHDVSGARVLVAGPTSAAVIADVASRAGTVDVLVRSWLDAQALRAALPDAIGVYCGPLDRFAVTPNSYAAVVALAGLDRLHSAEDDAPDAEAVLADLAGLVADGGDLFVAVDNEVGVDRLLSLDASARHGDANWPEGHGPDTAGLLEAGPIGPAEVVDVLAGRGLTPVEVWSCHGRRSDPLVAAPAGLLADRAADAVLLREISRAYDVRDRAAASLKDPAETVRNLVRAGLGAATAPLTVLHLRRGPAATAHPVALLVQEPVHDGSPAVAYRLAPGPVAWERTLLGESATYPVATGAVRDTAALVGPVPTGETLAVAIEHCIAAHDLTSAGELVRRYRDLLMADGDVVGPELVPVLPRTLALTADALVPLDRSWRALAAEPWAPVLVRGLLDLGADLLARAVRHPWSPASSAREVARALASAAGLEDLDTLLDEAVALDHRLRPAGSAPDFAAPGNAGQLSYAELAELAEQLGERAAQADAHIVWLLKRMQVRQRALRAARGQIHGLESSREMWIGRRVMVIRSLARRRRRRKEAAGQVPEGQWTGGGRNPDDDELRIEAELIPPGYVPDNELEVIATVEPAIDPTLDPDANPR